MFKFPSHLHWNAGAQRVGWFACVLFCMGACQETRTYSVTEVHEVSTATKTCARLEVRGMMCAHACGGKIKKELLEVGGVANATIDFEDKRAVNFAEVEFDPNQVNADALVHAVIDIAGGELYFIEAVEVTHFAKAASFR